MLSFSFWTAGIFPAAVWARGQCTTSSRCAPPLRKPSRPCTARTYNNNSCNNIVIIQIRLLLKNKTYNVRTQVSCDVVCFARGCVREGPAAASGTSNGIHRFLVLSGPSLDVAFMSVRVPQLKTRRREFPCEDANCSRKREDVKM